ncbi:hypothetical protein L1887_32878 [Cichorium endivia]|nr:hypothetical protein L1887_32878 [Cichorium endivia]
MCGYSQKPSTSGSGYSSSHVVHKRQTCYSCGVPRHIARNCPQPVHNQKGVQRGRSIKRHSLRSHLRDGDWNVAKARKQAKKGRGINPRDVSAKSNFTKSMSSQGSSCSSHWQYRPKAKGKSIRQSNNGSSIQATKRRSKPNYQWVPKGSTFKPSNCSVNTSDSILGKQDMTWEQVKYTDSSGRPSHKMEWVAKCN